MKGLATGAMGKLAVVFVLALSFAAVASSDEKPRFASIPVAKIVESAARSWGEGMQFVQADLQGRVFVLRGDTLDVFALTPSGGLEPRGRLIEGGSAADGFEFIDQAALSRQGDRWVTVSRPNRLQLFESGKRKAVIESPWVVGSIAFGKELTAAPLPFAADTNLLAQKPGAPPPPRVQTWDGVRWHERIPGQPIPRASVTRASYESLRGEHSKWMALSAEDQLWVVDKNAFHLERYSASSILLEEFRIGEGLVEWQDRSDEDYERLRQLAAENGKTFDQKRIGKSEPRGAYRAIAQGRDGLLYLLAETSDGLALDRFDPSRPAYERILLRGMRLERGNVTLAAGRYSFYVGERQAHDGIWEIPLEALENARWRQVPECTVNGTAIPIPIEEEAEPSGHSPRP